MARRHAGADCFELCDRHRNMLTARCVQLAIPRAHFSALETRKLWQDRWPRSAGREHSSFRVTGSAIAGVAASAVAVARRRRKKSRASLDLRRAVSSASEELELPELAVGTWAWGNRLLWQYSPDMDEDLRRSFDLCVNRGAFMFDTGDTYGTGDLDCRSEKLLGEFSRTLSSSSLPWPFPQKRLVLATKWAPQPWRLTRESLVEACRASVERMGRVDLGQLHWPPAFFHEAQLLDGLGDVYEQGLVRGIGLSNYGPVGLRRVVSRLRERGVPVATAQVQFSLLTESNDELVATCQDLGVRPIAYSPLCLGLLSGKYGEGSELPPPPRGWLFGSLLGNKELQNLLSLLGEIGQVRGKSVAQVAINWCVCKGAIPLVGVKNAKQAAENLGAIGWRLSDSEVSDLDAAAKRAPRTQPNPASVP
ncbi:unnamed protein product [Polarella glacialis]|uniref:NADP-dependent oxidoreductase domain-containing protein n=1 Tax=Polarella glacialis TaxID=89957 RepID=A0A813K010_POLGL|nr:unnamed protein product [Polarella glacialis]